MRPSGTAKRLGGILPRVLGELGLGDALAGAVAVEAWERIVGERLSAHARAISLADGVLRIEVESPAWMQEIGFHRIAILKRLAEECGRDTVRDLKPVLRRYP